MSTYMIGFDINERYSQISFYSEEMQEPQTVETVTDNYQLPLAIALKDGIWYVGNDAKRQKVVKNAAYAEDLFQKAVNLEKIQFAGETKDAMWLLAKYVELSLNRFEEIGQIVFTVPKITMEIGKMLKGVGQRAGISKNQIYVQDYKESFCSYMLYQPKELWQYEAALFHCDRYEVKAYMLRKIRTGYGKGQTTFITVDEVAKAQMEELSAVYPVLNVDRARDADIQFRQFVQGVFDKKLVSSVFLVGEGFENSWYPQSLKVLCNGRRAFLGNNLYSKGACYAAYRRTFDVKDAPIYLDETKMMEQICLKLRIGGVDKWYPLVTWGIRWYEADSQCEILLENTDDIEIHIESLVGNELQVVKVPMGGLPKRAKYTIRLQVQALFEDEKRCRISFKDLGFGEFFPATDFYIEQEIQLGGSNGQYNSLS